MFRMSPDVTPRPLDCGSLRLTRADCQHKDRQKPGISRAQIVSRRRSALVAPHSGQGVRTQISDDRAWLAYTTAQYIDGSNDSGILDEIIPFLEGAKLAAGEHDSFFQPTISDEIATLFEHCARALDQSLAVGGHGLPLMGTGDWNDGMNRVGWGGARARVSGLDG